MTIINANIYKNGDTTKPLAGYIRVLSRARLSDGANLFVSDPVEYPLVNGSVTISLLPTEVAKVSYNFTIFESAPAPVPGDDPEEDRLVLTFDAVVPLSLTPVNLNTLAQQSGLRYDQQDASLLTLAGYILNSSIFENRILEKLLNPRGTYSATAVYKKGDSVLYDGNGYLYTSNVPTAGNTPTNVTFWKQYVSKGAAGAGTIGDDSPYSSAWSGSIVAPSRDAIYDKIEQMMPYSTAIGIFAQKEDEVFRNARQDTELPVPANDNSSRLVDSAWVRSLTNPHSNQVPIGARVKWDNSLALPLRYLSANGADVSRLAYAALYTVYGNLYGSGNGSTTFTLPLDPGFIIYTGV